MSTNYPELGTPEFWQELKDNPARLAKEVCRIDLVDLRGSLQRHAALRAWVNAAYEVAKTAEEQAKWELTKTRARVYMKAKAENDPDTGKGKTVATLDAEVDLSEDVAAAQETLLEKAEVTGALKAMVTALMDRKDMLVQLGAAHRMEQKDYS